MIMVKLMSYHEKPCDQALSPDINEELKETYLGIFHPKPPQLQKVFCWILNIRIYTLYR